MTTDTPAARPPWMRAALALTVFIALAIVNTYPVSVTPASVIGRHGDSYFSVWRLAWVAHALETNPLQIFDGNIFYPERRTLAYSDAILLPATALAPFNWLGVRPLVIYNLFLVSTFVANAVAAYVLVYRLTGVFAAGVIGGVIFAFSPYRFEHFDHLEMQLSFWSPLAVLAWQRAVSRQTPWRSLSVGALVSAQVLSCIYYGVFLITWLGAMTLVWFWRAPLRAIVTATTMLLPAVMVLTLYSVPYLGNRSQLGDRRPGQIAGYSARLGDFVSAPSTNVLYGWTDTFGAAERHLFPGLVALGLVIIGVWRPIDRIRAVHCAGVVLALLLAVGTNGPIYGLLYEWVLPFRALRVPARADVLVLLGTSVLAGYGLSRLADRLRRQRLGALVIAAVIALASVEYLSKPATQDVDQHVFVGYQMLERIPDAVVFEWPVTVPWRVWDMVDVTYMYRSTLHWRPLVNGYSGFYPKSYLELLVQMRSFPDSGSISYLQQRGVTVVVIHERSGWARRHAEALERLARDPKLSVIASGWEGGGRVTFFRLAPPQPR